MKLIKITGPKGSGKSTLAKLLASYYEESNPDNIAFILALAQPMKDALETFGIDKNTQETKYDLYSVINYVTRHVDIPDRVEVIKQIVKEIKKEKEISNKPIGRLLLQYIGTNIIRKYDNDYFVRQIYAKIEKIKSSYPDALVIIDDVRFPNEAVKRLDNEFLIKLMPDNYIPDNHESEKYYDIIQADLTLKAPIKLIDFENILDILGLRSKVNAYYVWANIL
jgi:ABC-type dipeptide/oligopeptide/nickel transport system ATPase subunit